MDVSGGVAEGFVGFDADAVAEHRTADLGDELLAGIVLVTEASDMAVDPAVATRFVHGRMGEFVECGGVVFLRNLILGQHRHDDHVL